MSTEQLKVRSRSWYRYLNQGTYWIPRDTVPVLITSMDEHWRKNAAAFILRKAASIEAYYTFGELFVLGEPCAVVVAEISGRPIERIDPELTMLPTPGSMAADAYDRELAERNERPDEWLKTTELYKALIGVS